MDPKPGVPPIDNIPWPGSVAGRLIVCKLRDSVLVLSIFPGNENDPMPAPILRDGNVPMVGILPKDGRVIRFIDFDKDGRIPGNWPPPKDGGNPAPIPNPILENDRDPMFEPDPKGKEMDAGNPLKV